MQEYIERLSCTWSADSIRLINTPTRAARQKFFYVQEVGYFKTSPPYFTERANLNSYLLIYTLSGKGVLQYGGKRYDLCPGQACYLDCIPHHYYACDANGWEILWLHFNGNTAKGYYEEFVKSGFSTIQVRSPHLIEPTMRKILTLTGKKEIHSEILVSSLIVDLLTQFIIANNSDDTALSFMPDYIRMAEKELEHRFMESIRLQDLAALVGISKYHLLREFKRYTGSTPNEYVITLRLNYAKELLRYSSCSVGEIAYTCGFNQVSHFIGLFKVREGITPLQYRKEWNSN